MSDFQFDLLIEEIEQFNQNTSLQTKANYLKITNNPLYNELLKSSIDGPYITSELIKKFLNIAELKINPKAIDSLIASFEKRFDTK